MGKFAILLVDTIAEKPADYLFGYLGATSIKVSKGELLIASQELVQASDELIELYHFCLASNKTITLHAEVDDTTAAVLTDHQFMLLEAITCTSSLNTRFEVFSSGKCSWGSTLKVGDSVSLDISWLDAPVTATVHYIGEISGHSGTMFGVEIRNEEFSEWGETDGTCQGKRYFTCKNKSGLFVSLDKLSKAIATEGYVEFEAPSTPQESREAGQTTITPSSHSDDSETPARFERGSLIQVIDPPLYGVIRIMETLPKIQGMAAGIELEEDRKNCTDGTWHGKRYFMCPPRRGFFCPLSNLKLDQRFTYIDSSLSNPLKNVLLEEPEDQSISDDQLMKYLGERRGIQGHYNSCYLDATVFGLFALSDAFDQMLQTEARDPAGEEIREMLLKGIVNPLRKNGVVRHESIMTLRNKLEELGKIKRVNQDEKDPEEFLNMLFKYALSVDPFISIKRPFGIEEEYFVQLFLEPDESLELPPTVGQLLKKMFKEQNISFTKAANKLLIQIPRYGKQFKTYEKVIPTLQLDIVDLIEPLDCCFLCQKPAWKICSKCAASKDDQPTYFCDSCCSRVHSDCSDIQRSTDIHCNKEVADGRGSLHHLQLLSVICIETSHYVCFTRSIAQNQWIFFDSMADRVYNEYNIPKGVDCTEELNKWVYSGDKRLQSTPYRQLPELVRRFTHDIYLCVYIKI